MTESTVQMVFPCRLYHISRKILFKFHLIKTLNVLWGTLLASVEPCTVLVVTLRDKNYKFLGHNVWVPTSFASPPVVLIVKIRSSLTGFSFLYKRANLLKKTPYSSRTLDLGKMFYVLGNRRPSSRKLP